jgi:hypothetical protein
MREPHPLPDWLHPYFWDVDFDSLSWQRHRDFILQRVLQTGSWDAVCWLRRTLGDGELRAWFLARKGARLEPRRLRFWQLVLRLPARTVDRWVASARDNPWLDRLAP